MIKVSFIGLGNMGKPMALNLITSNFDLNIFDINKKLYKSFRNIKCKKAKQMHELVDDTKVFITMLPNGNALKKAVLDKGGLIHFIKKKNNRRILSN